MKSLFAVKNSTGETWPAFGMARLGAVVDHDGRNADLTVYTLVKPDGAGGIYVVNGASPLPTARNGTAIFYLDAQRVAVPSGTTVAVNDEIGSVSGLWTAGIGGSGGQFRVADAKNTENIAPVVAKSSSGQVREIRFQIVSSDVTTATAFGEVRGWDEGFKLPDVPGDLNTIIGISPPLGVVEICDPAGCYFDEPSDILLGRQGWARRMDSNTPDQCRRGYAPFSAKWEVFALCCRKPVCEVF